MARSVTNSERARRAVPYIVTCVLLLAALVGAAVFVIWRTSVRLRDERQRVDDEREKRERVVAEIAPAPVPSELPLVGAEGRDAYGYPTRFVDRAGLRALLQRSRFEELTRYVEQLQQDFEDDPRNEYGPNDAADAFASHEPELAPLLDAWVAAAPKSFAPHLARGAHRVGVGFARRGTKFANETATADFKAMASSFASATADLDRALALRPRLVAAIRQKLRMARTGPGSGDGRPLVDAAIEICPTCFQVRVTYLFGIAPRWGGSYAEMSAFAREAPVAQNPRLKLLEGYVDFDRANALGSKEAPAALAAIERACALGEHWEFLYERGRIRSVLKDYPRALADLDRAVALRPGVAELLFQRAWVNLTLQARERAGQDLLDGLRVDPADSRGQRLVDDVVKGLVYAAWQHQSEGRRVDALRVLTLASELAPSNGDVMKRRAAVELGERAEGEIAALEAKARANPDDFVAHRDFDYALAKQGQFGRVVAMWNVYLAQHPGDGHAYLERGGAYYHLGKMAESRADAAKACELGVAEGCARAKSLPQ